MKTKMRISARVATLFSFVVILTMVFDSYSAVAQTTLSHHERKNFIPSKYAEFAPFVADVNRRITKAWYPPMGNENKKVTVAFSILGDGKLSSLRLQHSSRLPIADKAALVAVEHAAPFRPLPQNKRRFDFQFDFDYDAYAGGRATLRNVN